MSTTFERFADLLERECGATYFETRESEHVRAALPSGLMVECFPSEGDITLSVVLGDFRDEPTLQALDAAIVSFNAKIPPAYARHLSIKDEGLVLYANWWLELQDTTDANEVDALRTFVGWCESVLSMK